MIIDILNKPENVIKNLALDSADVDRLITLWIKKFPKDEPIPKTPFTVYVNKKYGEVDNYVFLFMIKSAILDTLYKQDRFAAKCITLLVDKPIDFLEEWHEKDINEPTIERVEKTKSEKKKQEKKKVKKK